MDKERKEKTARVQDAEADGIIEGRNAVIEALRAGTTIDKIFIQKGETDKTLGHIASTARAAGVVVVDADKRKLDFMSRTHAHQGVIALTSVREYVSVEDILNIAHEKGENPLIVVCDEISDPHNLGAIIRTAECAGAHGVVIPKRRSAGLTSIVAKTSAGAVSYVPVARVPNIPALLEQLQKEGVWVFGTAAEGTSDLYSADLKGPAAIVIGSEGDGMTRLVREKCDFLVSIPMKGKISSLNASAAAAILKGRKVARRVRAIIIPATQHVYKECIRLGYMDTFIDAGCVVSTPTCGPCLGGYMGVLAEGERCVATTNRNFVGRMGHTASEVYLASPAVAAASAIAGHIASPETV